MTRKRRSKMKQIESNVETVNDDRVVESAKGWI